jgi:hypothetical protein
MQAGYSSSLLVQCIFIASLKSGYTIGESVKVVDFSDLAIYDAFNDSYLAVFNAEYLYSGNIAK